MRWQLEVTFQERCAGTWDSRHRGLWTQEQTFYGSPAQTNTVKVPWVFMERLTDAVCYAA
jgi:hypothetical protein